MHIPTHGLMGWVAAHQSRQPLSHQLWLLMASVAPDIDGISLLGGVQSFQKWHHTFGHCWLFAIFFGGICLLWTRSIKTTSCSLALIFLHHFCDWIGSAGPGPSPWPIYWNWPLDSRPYVYSHQWELNAWPNLLVTISLIVLVSRQIHKSGQTPLDCLFPSLGRHVQIGLTRLYNRLPCRKRK